jgi:hypothetical protein
LDLLGITNGSSGRWYTFWNGFVRNIPLIAAAYIFGRKHNCHAHRCWRVGRMPVEGTDYTVCRKHHPDGDMSGEDIASQASDRRAASAAAQAASTAAAAASAATAAVAAVAVATAPVAPAGEPAPTTATSEVTVTTTATASDPATSPVTVEVSADVSSEETAAQEVEVTPTELTAIANS